LLGHECLIAPLAYAGLGPGQELAPYFFALLAWAGAALLAVLHRPISALLHVFSRHKSAPVLAPESTAPEPGAETGQ
jgi:hypothetical protein